MKIKSTFPLIAGLIVLVLMMDACREEVIEVMEPDAVFNPYDTIDFSSTMIEEVQVDSGSFLGLHTYIFSRRCALPACHDGSFEPDYRTLNSAYNTLVYHPVVKNTPDSFFTYRVMPGDTNKSWLHERLTTNDEVLGRMPLYDQPLGSKELGLIVDWILEGAPDVLGNSPMYPDFGPTAFGLLAYLPDAGNMRVDSIRYNGRFYNPFIVPQNANVKIYFGLYDTDVDGEIIFPTGFTYYKAKFSVNEPGDFSGAMQYNMVKEFVPFFGPTIFGFEAPYFYHLTINTGQFSAGDIVYVRVYVNDGSHAQPSEIPDSGSQIYIISFFSFIVI